MITPVNVLKALIAVAVGMLSSYGLLIDSAALPKLLLIIQLLLATLLTVNGIQGLNNDNKEKRSISYIYLLGAILVIILDIEFFLVISKYW